MDLTYGDHGVSESGKIDSRIVCKKVLTKEKYRCYNNALSKQNAQAYDAVRLHTNILNITVEIKRVTVKHETMFPGPRVVSFLLPCASINTKEKR